jgi:hypothetical protein
VPAKDTTLRPLLTAAATVLREMSEVDLEDTAKLREIKQADLADFAEAIDSILVPNGWGRLRRSDPTTSESVNRNMGVRMPREWRTQIQERAKKAGNGIKDDMNEGFEKYLAGEFEPIAPKLSPHGASDDMVLLNARPKDDLRTAIDQQGDHTPALVAGAYLMSKYRVGPYAPKKAAKK